MKRKEDIIILMDRVASLQERLCGRETTSPEINCTLSHRGTRSEIEVLKAEVSRLRAAKAEKDERIAEPRQPRSKTTGIILRAQKFETNEQNEAITNVLQQSITANKRVMNVLQMSLSERRRSMRLIYSFDP